MEKEGGRETCTVNSGSLVTGGLDESKKVLGVLYRGMKPLLDDFNPETTVEYDDCLRGIPHDHYIKRASELKAQYGNFSIRFFLLTNISDIEMNNLMNEHDVRTLKCAALIGVDPNGI